MNEQGETKKPLACVCRGHVTHFLLRDRRIAPSAPQYWQLLQYILKAEIAAIFTITYFQNDIAHKLRLLSLNIGLPTTIYSISHCFRPVKWGI